jgi:PAS domain S-box-containing protein
MVHPQDAASFGSTFSFDDDSAAEAAIDDSEFVDQIRGLVDGGPDHRDETLHALFQLGTEWLSVEHAHVARVDPAQGTHTIDRASGAEAVASPGVSRDLSATYCRRVIAQNATLALGNAPEQGWADDPAYEAFGWATYLGAKVVVDGTLYGTLCFADREARGEPVGAAEAAAVTLLAHTVGRLLGEAPPGRSAQPTADQLGALFEQSPNMINIHDAEGNLIAPNPHLCDKTGYTEEELVEMKVWDLDRDVSPERAQAAWDDMTPGDRTQWEGTFRRKDGTTFPVEVDLRRLDVNGAAQFVVTSRDISARKDAEEALRRSEELHRETLRNITDTVVLARDDGSLAYVCPNVSDIFGYDREEVEQLGTISALLGGNPVEEHALDGGREQSNIEWRATDAQGTPHDLLINVRRVSIQEGRWMYTCRDVTERKKRSRQFEAVFNHTYQFTGLLDPDGTLVEANDTALAFGEVEEEDVLGKPVWTTEWFQTGAETRERLRDAVERAAQGTFVRYEEEVQGAEGTRIIDLSLRPVEGPEGEVAFIIPEGRDITERKAAERQLQEEHDLLNRILETSPAAIVVLNTDGAFVEASGRAEEVLGLEKDEVTDRAYNDPAWCIRAPDGGSMTEEDLPFSRVMATEEPVYDVEHRIEWPDGTQRLLSVSGAPLHAAHGELDGAVFHVNDITEQRAVEQNLREERDRFATLFHNLPTPVVHGFPDADGALQVEAVNERFEEVFGYEEHAVRAGRLKDLIIPEDEQGAAAGLHARLRRGELINQEVRRRAADGVRDFQVQVALRREDGRPTEGFAIYTDITERKDRERRLMRRRALLEAQAEATLDGLFVVDEDRRVVFHNDHFRDIWDLAPDEIGPEATQEAVLLEAGADLLPDPEAFREKVQYLCAHPHAESRDLIQLTDGRWVDRYSAPIRDDEGHRFGRLWVFRDVTQQRKMLERLLEVQEEERRRIDQEIHDGMGGLLTSLQFTIDIARRNAQENGDATEHFDELETLVSELSTVSRTISRKLYPSDLSEHGLAQGITSLISEVEQKYDLDVDLYSEVETTDRFSTLVERSVYWIVQEILTNVVRHEAAGTPQVLLNKRGEQLYLHVFDESAALDGPAAAAGEDVQLEAIRRRVEWLDGEVRIDPIPDEGVRMSIILPVRSPFLASSLQASDAI